jgi:organic hydroperoxide reductase OsmC/OhrA
VGTFGGALEARQIPAAGDRLVGRATGEVEVEDRVLVLRRIHVKLELRVAPGEATETARRVHGFFADSCPLYRSLRGALSITTELIALPG